MTLRELTILTALTSSMAISHAHANDSFDSDKAPMPLPDVLNELDRHAEEFGDQARDTVEEFLKLVGPMLDQLSLFITDLPTYHAPEVLPNGDIIIRRKREADQDRPLGPDGEIET